MHIAGTKGKERICPLAKRKNLFKMSDKYKLKMQFDYDYFWFEENGSSK